MMSTFFYILSAVHGLMAASFIIIGAYRLTKGRSTPSFTWGVLIVTTIFVFIIEWFILWSGQLLVLGMLISPIVFFVSVVVLSFLLAMSIAPRCKPKNLLQMCIATTCLVFLGSLPFGARLVQLNGFWMAAIPSYPGSELIEKQTKLHMDMNTGPELQVIYRTPTSTSSALAFSVSELRSRGWKVRHDAVSFCWIEQNTFSICRYQYCRGNVQILFDAASSHDQHSTAAEGAEIKFIMRSIESGLCASQADINGSS